MGVQHGDRNGALEPLASGEVVQERSPLAAFMTAVVVVVGGGMVALWAAPGAVARLSLLATGRLAVETTLIAIAVAVVPAYLVARTDTTRLLSRALFLAASTCLLVPTIARTLTFSAAFAYYGPVTTAARSVGLWPESEPLASSHTAVVFSLVTLYLPLVILIVGEGIRGLGTLPDRAASLGASPWLVGRAVVLPGLVKPIATAALVVFSQVFGVLVTPRVLGSSDVTIAVLIDTLLKQQLDTAAALRVVVAEMAFALPAAAVAAYLVRSLDRPARRELAPADGAGLGWVTGFIPLSVLLAAPIGLLLLAVSPTPVLDLSGIWRLGFTTRWFASVLADPSWRDVVAPSGRVWATAVVLSIGLGATTALAVLARARLRLVAQWMALVAVLIPQNALAVILAWFLSRCSRDVVTLLPAWAWSGAGEAVIGGAFTFLIFDRALQRLRPGLRVGATLGAGPWTLFRLVVLPSLLQTAVGAVVMVSLISLDDVVFVRYLSEPPVNTFATELFARARYSASPDLAAASTLAMAGVGLAAAAGYLGLAWRRTRVDLPRSGAL